MKELLDVIFSSATALIICFIIFLFIFLIDGCAHIPNMQEQKEYYEKVQKKLTWGMSDKHKIKLQIKNKNTIILLYKYKF